MPRESGIRMRADVADGGPATVPDITLPPPARLPTSTTVMAAPPCAPRSLRSVPPPTRAALRVLDGGKRSHDKTASAPPLPPVATRTRKKRSVPPPVPAAARRPTRSVPPPIPAAARAQRYAPALAPAPDPNTVRVKVKSREPTLEVMVPSRVDDHGFLPPWAPGIILARERATGCVPLASLFVEGAAEPHAEPVQGLDPVLAASPSPFGGEDDGDLLSPYRFSTLAAFWSAMTGS